MLGVGIVEDIRKCVTTDFKNEGNPVYLVGETRDEMGASALFRRYGGSGGQVPTVDSAALSARTDLLLNAMSKGLVRSCHDCSDGGLAITLAEMCLGGDLGFYGDLYRAGRPALRGQAVLRVQLPLRGRGGTVQGRRSSSRWPRSRPYRIGEVGRGRMTIRDGKVGSGPQGPGHEEGVVRTSMEAAGVMS